MKSLITTIILLLQFQSLNAEIPDANGLYLADKILAIERLMLSPGTIDFQVAPCNVVLNGPPTGSPEQSGDQTAAQWVRTVFHDFITANVTAGTGGLDASVGFESARPENNGTVFPNKNFIDQTIFGFNLFSTVFISTSDFIAIGLAEAILSCDVNSPMIKLRAGRIDAPVAGPSGVPGPSDPFPKQLAAFKNAGFTQTEMIQAVACGHTLGGVHNRTFPQITGKQPTIGTSGLDSFDDTPYVFDNLGVSRYLSGVGKAGGPLVTTANGNFSSDKNIFESDGNATIKAMAGSQTAFEAACFPVFEKMIDTVPSHVTLSGVIGPRQWITMFSFLDLNSTTGAVSFFGRIGTYSRTAVPKTASYQYGTVSGGNTGLKISQVGVTQSNIINTNTDPPATRFPYFGNTTFYDFNDILTSPSINSLTVQGTYTEPINLNIFVVPSMSFTNSATNPTVLVRAAVLTTLAPSGTTLTATMYYASEQPGTLSPLYKQINGTLSHFTVLGNYTIFSGEITRPNDPPPNGGGDIQVDVRLGTTQRSPKASVFGTFLKTLFATCAKSDLTQCP